MPNRPKPKPPDPHLYDAEILEDPLDRAHRHAVEGRLQWATVEQLQDVDAKVDDILSEVKLVKGWLIGDISDTGIPRAGIVQKVQTIDGAYRWITGMVALGTGAVVGNLCLNIYSTFTGHPK